jgi:hypothetical protein
MTLNSRTKFADVLADLADNGGAILGWQVANQSAYFDAARAGVIRFDEESDCYVHPDATGNLLDGFTMPERA